LCETLAKTLAVELGVEVPCVHLDPIAYGFERQATTTMPEAIQLEFHKWQTETQRQLAREYLVSVTDRGPEDSLTYATLYNYHCVPWMNEYYTQNTMWRRRHVVAVVLDYEPYAGRDETHLDPHIVAVTIRALLVDAGILHLYVPERDIDPYLRILRFLLEASLRASSRRHEGA